MRKIGLVAAAAVVASLALLPTGMSFADTTSALCSNTTYVDGSTNKTKGTNYGSNVDLVLKNSVTTFALVECVVSGIPAGATVNSTTLDVFSRSVNTPHTVELRDVTASWVENSVTWNTRPAYSATVRDSKPGDLVAGSGEWVSLNASNVTGNGTYRYALTTPSTSEQRYASDDYLTDTTRRPKLTVNWSASVVAPVASFTANPTSGTVPLTVAFTDTSTGSPTSWAWTFGDGSTSTVQSPSHTYTTVGTYSVTLTATNAGGSSTTSQTVTVNQVSAPTASFTATPTSGTAPLSVAFTDTSTGSPTAWAWDFGDGGTSTVQNPSHTYSVAGTYTVTLTATSAAGSDAEVKTGYITVTDVPPGPQPNGPPGSWSLTFQDEFDGTSLDTTKWSAEDGWTGQNNVTTRASNVTVANGVATLQLSSSTEGAGLITDPSGTTGTFQAPVGSYVEARVYFPGVDGSQPIYNWPAWWTSGDSWPAAGEWDVAEGFDGTLTVNYHSPSGSHNLGTVAGDWNNAFHTFGVHRKATSADVYWDGVLVKSYSPTDDNGGGHYLRLNVGKSNSRTPVLGDAGAMKVDYVRAWQ